MTEWVPQYPSPVRVDIRGSGESDGLLFDEYAGPEALIWGSIELCTTVPDQRCAPDFT
jgi:hypothetical protein